MLKEFTILKNESKAENGAENSELDEDTLLIDQIKILINKENPELLTKPGKILRLLLKKLFLEEVKRASKSPRRSRSKEHHSSKVSFILFFKFLKSQKFINSFFTIYIFLNFYWIFCFKICLYNSLGYSKSPILYSNARRALNLLSVG